MQVEEHRSWSFSNPVEVLFGVNQLSKLSDVAVGKRSLLITTKGTTERGLTEDIRKSLPDTDLTVLDKVFSNPEVNDIEAYCRIFASKGFDQIVAVGGGSSIDTAKALNVGLQLAQKQQSIREVVEANYPLTDIGLIPVIAIPTTSGTGSEVTPFATLWDKAAKKKHSLSGSNLYPTYAVIDPSLTLTLPLETTLFTALDALSHAFESIWSKRCTPITIGFALRSIRLIFEVLPTLIKNPKSLSLRSSMAEASLLSGLAISNTRTALAHAISYPITIHYAVPHGLACSFTLPALLDFNSRVDDGRLREIAHELNFSSIAALSTYLANFLKDLKVYDYLHHYVPNLDDLVRLSDEMFAPGRADNNLRTAEISDVEKIILSTC